LLRDLTLVSRGLCLVFSLLSFLFMRPSLFMYHKTIISLWVTFKWRLSRRMAYLINKTWNHVMIHIYTEYSTICVWNAWNFSLWIIILLFDILFLSLSMTWIMDESYSYLMLFLWILWFVFTVNTQWLLCKILSDSDMLYWIMKLLLYIVGLNVFISSVTSVISWYIKCTEPQILTEAFYLISSSRT